MDLIEGRMTLEGWVDLAASLGLDGLDFGQAWFRDRRPATIAALRRRIEDTGMQACMLTCAPDFTHPDATGRQATFEEMRRMIELANQLGAPLIRVTAGQAHPSVSRVQGVAWVCEGVMQLLPYTEPPASPSRMRIIPRPRSGSIGISPRTRPSSWRSSERRKARRSV
jgi:sugar phosphate isomerase/epimerase